MEFQSKRIRPNKSFKILLDIIYLIVGVLFAGFGLKSFLLPNNFLDGGVTGISLLVSEITGIELSFLIFCINIPFVFLGKKHISKEFALKTISAIAFLSLLLMLFPYPVMTSDKLLVSFFGGFFVGIGVGLAIRGGAVLDGTEVLALFINNRFGISVGDFILFLNIIIFSFAAALFGIETALYGILTYLAASKAVDFVIQGIEEYVSLTIISSKSEVVRRLLVQKLGNGVTIYKGKRGLVSQHLHTTDHEIDIIVTVVTRLEVNRVINEITVVDPSAFIIQNNVSDVTGGLMKIRKPHIEHKKTARHAHSDEKFDAHKEKGWTAPTEGDKTSR